MANDPIKIDIAYKRFAKREYTSTQKRWHEEFAGRALTVKSRDVWTEEITVIPPPTSTSTIDVLNNITLTEDITVDDHKAWLVCEAVGDLNTRLKDFIQPDGDLLRGYFVKIYDTNDQRIYVGDESNWEFDYANGILTFLNQPQGFVSPFKIDAYRYIGQKGVGSAGSLDEAYDGSFGDGSGRVINVDFGPVEFNASNDQAPIQINPINYTPSTGVAGQMFLRNGIMFVYDDVRTKWLSLNRNTIIFGSKIADGRFLNLNNFSSNMAGWPALRDGTVVGITVQASSGNLTKDFSILKNNSTISLFDFSLSSLYYANGNLDIDFQENDLIKILASSTNAAVYNIIVNLEIAWRI